MKRRSLALFLSFAMALGIMAAGPAAMAAWDGENSTLTVRLPEDYGVDLNGGAEESPVGPLGVVYDLYLVATARDVPGYDAYTYDGDCLTEAFAGLAEVFPDMDTVDNDAWRALAWRAAALVLDPGTPGEGDVPEIPASLLLQPREEWSNLPLDTPAPDLEAGLYLVIAHGDGMEPADYIRPMEPGEDGAAHVGTLAWSADYAYTFQPELVSLPGQNTGEDDLFDGTWNHAVSVTLKPDRELRYGKAVIRKTIDVYELGEPATFVFEITGEKDGEEVYRNVAGLTFAAGGTGPEEVELDRIPIGSTVTVREIYSGANYTGVVTEQSGELGMEILELEFENKRDTEERHGHGIINRFTFNGDAWEHTPVGPGTGSEEG